MSCGEFLRVDDHLQLVVAAADEVGAGDAFHPLKTAFDFVFGHPSHRFDVDVRWHEMSDLRVFLGEFVESEELQICGAAAEYPLELVGL